MFEVIIVSLKPITNEAYSSIPVKTIIDEKANQAEARNIAEKIAKGEVLGFCDDDCILPAHWIESALKHFSNAKVATVGGPSIPPLKNVSLREIISGLLMMSFLGAGKHRKAYTPDSEAKPRFCTTVEIICANMFVDRARFREVGGFDGIVPQEEDRLNNRFLRKGYKLVYDPECFNIHYQRPWGIKAIRNIFWLMAGQGSLTVKRHAPSSIWYLIPPLFVIGLIAGPLFFTFSLFLRELFLAFIFIYAISVVFETLRLLLKAEDDLTITLRLAVLMALPLAFLLHNIASGVGFLYGFFRRLIR
jgi:GT2 family glycosyltransferase